MNIVLFIIFLAVDLIMVLVCKFAYGNRDKYEEGMLMGVHIPAEEVSNGEIQKICSQNKKVWNKFHLINLLAGVLVCLICFISFEVFLIVWFIWLTEYIAVLYYLVIAPHKEMYRLKIRNNWINEKTRHIVNIDTQLSALSDKMAYNWKWHLLIVFILLSTCIPLLQLRSDIDTERAGWILYASSVGISLLFMLLHFIIVGKQNVVYSQNLQVNLSVNKMIKHSWSVGFLSVNCVNAAAGCYMIFQLSKNQWLGGIEYGVYITLQTLAVLALLIPVLSAYRKKQAILAKDMDPVYVDDDEYWKNGWYSNPNDRHLLVQDRMSSTNFSFNMARPAAKIFCTAMIVITAAVLIWVAVLMMQFRNAEVTFEYHDDQVRIEAVRYQCEFNISDIESVQMIQELPDDRFIRTNGGSTDKYNIGHFRGKETGTCMMFIYKGYSPILEVKLKDKIIFVNSKQKGETENWYNQLKRE